MKLRKVILHTLSIIGGLLHIALLITIISFPTITVFFTALIVYLALLLFIQKTTIRIQGDHYQWQAVVSLIVSVVASVLLLSITEMPQLKWFLYALYGLITASILDMPTRVYTGQMTQTEKPVRRIALMIWVWNMYALSTFFFAAILFFPNVSSWVWLIADALGYSATCYIVWHVYLPLAPKTYLFWLALIALVMLELLWMISLLPFGYTVSAFLATWLWYTIQLYVRFDMSPRGIIWRRQLWYLGVSITVFLYFTYSVIQWV